MTQQIILVRKVTDSKGDTKTTNFPVTEALINGGQPCYFYQPHGFWVYKRDIGRKFNIFDGSTITWSVGEASC